MARGWESKSVEAQQEEASRPAAGGNARRLSPADVERLAARRKLELARARALADLRLATQPAHRAMLERTLAALDEGLAATDRAIIGVSGPDFGAR
jgi:hypothetical protein